MNWGFPILLQEGAPVDDDDDLDDEEEDKGKKGVRDDYRGSLPRDNLV